MCVSVCVCVCVRASIHPSISQSMRACMQICAHTCVMGTHTTLAIQDKCFHDARATMSHACACVRVCVWVYACTHVRMVCMHACMHDQVAGVTLLAVANGAGDVAVVVASAVGSHSATQIAVGELLGSGMFVSCFVLGVIAYNFPFEATREFLRDCMFLLVAVAWLGATVLDGAITTLESLSFVALYAVYLFVVVTGHFGGAGARGPRGGVAEGEAVVATAGAGRGDDEIGKGGDGKRWLPLQLMRGWQPPIAETNDGADGADGGAWDRWGGIVEYVNPVNDEIVKGGSLRDRVLMGLRVPAVVVLRLSVPVVDETRQHMAWNKTALMAQVCVCVCVCVFCACHTKIHTYTQTYIHTPTPAHSLFWRRAYLSGVSSCTAPCAYPLPTPIWRTASRSCWGAWRPPLSM